MTKCKSDHLQEISKIEKEHQKEIIKVNKKIADLESEHTMALKELTQKYQNDLHE